MSTETPQTDTATVFADLMAKMLEIQQQQATSLAVQTERTAPKDHPNYHNKSIYNPEGLPDVERARLKCEFFLGPFPIEGQLTEAEVAALNKLDRLEKGHIEKVDGSIVPASIAATYDDADRLRKLTILVNLRKDANPQHFPPLRMVAEQLAAQVEAANAVAA